MPDAVKLKQAVASVAVYEFVELTLEVEKPDAANPFTDVAVNADVTPPNGSVAGIGSSWSAEHPRYSATEVQLRQLKSFPTTHTACASNAREF